MGFWGCAFLLQFFLFNIASAGLIKIQQKYDLQLNQNHQVEICWVNGIDVSSELLKKDIQNYLKAQLTQRAGLSISFLGNCFEIENPMKPIGIAFYDAEDVSLGIQNTLSLLVDKTYPGHPTTYFQGSWTQTQLIDIVLTSQFKNVQPSLVQQMSPLNFVGKQALLLSIALHETLHSLGVAHEQDRPDSTCESDREGDLPKSYTLVGDYDSDSIMNHCRTHKHNFNLDGPIPLSEGDIQTVQFLYPVSKKISLY